MHCDKALISQLELFHAEKVEHINGKLIQHLKGTYDLLKKWGASESLCKAGLYHAVYGTVGFKTLLISNTQRNKIRGIIGSDAEKIVYLYCAADRDYFWPQIGLVKCPIFLNRFTGDKNNIEIKQMKDFCELTVANELEIASDNLEFVEKYASHLTDLFTMMKPYISQAAYDHFQKILVVR